MTGHVRFRVATIANALLMGALVACGAAGGGGDAKSKEWKTERTTVGDTTVVRLTGASTVSASLTLAQELSIGKIDGHDYEMFEAISHVTPTDDGGILFFDSGAATVRRFDSTGKYLNSFGRKGKGPGEYTEAYNIDIMPDGNVLVEGDVTLNLFTHDGKSVVDRDIAFKDPETLGSQRGVTADGYVHVSRTMYDSRYPDSVLASGNRLTATVVHRMKIDGQPVDTVFQPKSRAPSNTGIEYRRPGSAQRGPSYMAIPLTPRFLTSYSSLGYWISGGDDTTYSITLHRREGGLLRIESDAPRVVAAPEERAFHLAALTTSLKRYNASTPNLDVIPLAKAHFTAINTDADGRIWVKLSQPAVREPIDTLASRGSQSGHSVMIGSEGEVIRSTTGGYAQATERWVEPIVYDIFTPTGDFVGRLKLPPRSTFGNASGEKVWLVVKDDLDVETLVRYRLLNSTSG